MKAYFTRTSKTVESDKTRRFLKGVKAKNERLETEHIYVDSGGELSRLVEADMTKNQNTNDQSHDFQTISEDPLLNWENCPAKFGRESAKNLFTARHSLIEANPLKDQLIHLKQRKPKQQFFRFAFINSLGTNLGDTLVGITALNILHKVMTEALGKVEFDFLMGPFHNPYNAEMLQNQVFCGRVLKDAISLNEFTIYDGYFDFSDLIAYGKYSSLPIVDWFLWWLGLKPQDFSMAEKQNQIKIPQKEFELMANHLPKRNKNHKFIFFNPKASVELRSFLPDEASLYLDKLAKKHPKWTFFLDFPLEHHQPNIIDLNKQTNSIQKHIALIAHMDAVITVDTMSLHIANALQLPCIAYNSSIPAEHFCYYPNAEIIQIPNAEKLPAWRKTKVENQEWLEYKADYQKAWSEVSVAEASSLLKSKLKNTRALKYDDNAFYQGTPKAKALVEIRNGISHLTHEPIDPIWQQAIDIQKAILSLKAKRGISVLSVAPSNAEVLLYLAPAIYPNGQLTILEAREIKRKLIESDMIRETGASITTALGCIPWNEKKTINISQLNPAIESNVRHWGNAQVQHSVAGITLDSLNLSHCEIVILNAPCIFLNALAGMTQLIQKNQPLILLSVLPIKDQPAIQTFLQNFNYQLWISPLGKDQKFGFGLAYSHNEDDLISKLEALKNSEQP